ncbi:hypothetical protein CRYUN_Cryun28dG0102200 [Craigia yunnanensis]
MMVIMTLIMPMIATDQSSPLSSLSSPASLFFHPLRTRSSSWKQELDQKAIFQEDYGVWNPTPRSGGAYASPVPHAKVRQHSTSLPKSFRG